jgi:plasmid replication initiation protein
MEAVGTKKEQSLTLKTPQSLIHIKHTITLLQYKIWILLLQELKKQFDANEPADEKGFRYIPMQNLVERLGYTLKKSDIWNDLVGIGDQQIAFNMLEKDGKSARYGARFISEFKVSTNRIGFKFPSVLEDVMHGLDDAEAIFHKLNWEIFNHFSGKYEAIIYKLCKDYLGVGRTPYITVADLREYMGLKNGEYSEFMKLNEWVITKPLKNINSSPVSDISVFVEYHRKGRKVEGLHFTMKSKNQKALPFVEPENNPAFTLAKVTISQADQQAYLAKMPAEQIHATLARANQYAEELEKKGKKVNYGAIYKKAMNENWGEQFAQQKALEIEPVAPAPKKKADPQPVDNGQPLNQPLWDRLFALADDEKRVLVEAYLATLKGLLKAQLTAEYAGLKLGVIELPFFAVGFGRYLAKLWGIMEEAA